MTPCPRPGCGGTVEDGYCGTCGMAPPSTATAAGYPAAQPSQEPYSGPSGRFSTPSARFSNRSVRLSGPTGVTSGRTTSSRSGRRGTTRTSARGRLGAGLVEVPPVPYRDPANAVLSYPQVPESKRFCSRCGEPVGRGREGSSGRAEGYCRKCGALFSFAPKLTAGDLVGGQYEVLGCLTHGGLGWIYLARDRNVHDRWVVLKGLLDTGDADALAAAVAERRYLAEVEHPNIVKIFNFVQHPDRRTGSLVGYIVMEYVGGQSLKELAVARRRAGEGPMPLGQVIAYALEILPALGYLHSRGLLYCDFKPDNLLQTEEQLKLIDLGAVRWADDDQSPVYGTGGYQSPEIAEFGPSVSSDLYTVARTMAVLSFDFKGYTNALRHSLPDPGEVPLLTQHESFYRLLRRATDPDPDRRFDSAEEMAEQLTGVLREVMAGVDGRPRPGVSRQFTSERRPFGSDIDSLPVVSGNGTGPDDPRGIGRADPAARLPTAPDPTSIATALPVPQVDPTDPSAGFLATASAASAEELIETLSAAQHPGVEVQLRLARARIEAGDIEGATRDLAELEASDPGDWRVRWCHGLAALTAARPDEAWVAFDQVWDAVPGELAPKLALAVCAECCGYPAVAARNYAAVWSTDQSYVSAAFGLARMLQSAGDHRAAVGVLQSVPVNSSHYVAAQVAAVRARTQGRAAHDLTSDDLVEAAGRLETVDVDPGRREALAVELLEAALAWVLTGAAGNGGNGGNGGRALEGRVVGFALDERSLRLGLERSYRTLARLARDVPERLALVDRANDVRPRTLV